MNYCQCEVSLLYHPLLCFLREQESKKKKKADLMAFFIS